MADSRSRRPQGRARTHRARRVTLVIVGSVVGVLALALGTVLTVGGLFVPAVYLQPWAKSYAAQFTDPRMKVVAQALLAPSGHNMQPWTVTLDTSDPDVLYLYTDPKRLTLAVDPLARQTMVRTGACGGRCQSNQVTGAFESAMTAT